MSPAQKRGWEQFSDHFIVPYQEGNTLDESRLFPGRADRPLIMDIGFGMGRELAELAETHKDFNYIGVEVHPPGIGRLLLDLGERGITNVRIIPHDAVEVCHHMVRPGQMEGIHLFFPDPWPKARHHKRRLVRQGFPELIAPVVKDGGYLYAVTDWEDYAEQIRDVMDHANEFSRDTERYEALQQVRPRTAFERKGLAKGHAIFEFVYRRRPR